MPTLVGRLRNDASSDDSSSNGSYACHTDNDNSSIEDSEDDCFIVPGIQEKCRDDNSSDADSVPYQEKAHPQTDTHIPHSIDTRPIIPPWVYDRVDDDDYDADHKGDISQLKKGMLDPIRIQREGSPIVETVTEEETEEGIEEVEPPTPQPTHNSQIPTTTKKLQPPLAPEYDPMIISETD